MPQLDLFSLGNQFFWGTIFFLLFYFIIGYYVIPSVFSVMFARTFYINKIGDNSIKLVTFCFVFVAVSSVQYSDIGISIRSTLDNIYANKFVYNVALNEHVALELAELYDVSYFNDDEK